MILDRATRFSDAQAITADALSTDWIDRLAPKAPFDAVDDDSVSAGEPMDLIVHTDIAFNNLTSLQVTLESDDNSGMASSNIHLDRTFTLAQLAAGRKLTVGTLDGGLKTEQFLRVRFNVNGTNPAAGTISAYLIRSKDNEFPIAPNVPLS